MTPEQMAAMADYQRELAARRARAAAVGTTAAGKGIRGQDAAGYVDSRRDWVEGGIDEDAAWMTGKETLDRTAAVTEQLAAQEQFYFDQEQRRRIETMRTDAELWKATLDAQQQHFATSSANARQAAQLQTARLEYEITKSLRDEEELYKPSDSGAAEALALAKEVKDLAEADQGLILARLVEQRRTQVGDPNWRPSEMEMQALRDSATAMLAQGAGGATVNEAKAAAFAQRAVDVVNTHRDNPQEMMAILRTAAEDAGVSLDSVARAEPALAAAIQAGDDHVEAARQDIVKKRVSQEDEWVKRASATHGASGQYAETLGAMGAKVEKQKAALGAMTPTSELAIARSSDFAPAAAKAPAKIAAIAPLQKAQGASQAAGLEAPPSADEQLFGLPVKPASDAQARTLQMLDLIEEYPDHPPLVEARNGLMKSQEFAQYKKSRGYEGLNDEDVLREMSREYRKQYRANRREFNDRRRDNIAMGVSPGFGPGGRPAPNTREAPIKGAE